MMELRELGNRMNVKPLFSALIAFLLLGLVPGVRAADPLPRSTPEAQGVLTKAIRDFVAAVDKIDTLHSFVVVRHGHVIAEAFWSPESADKPHVLWSLSKS